MCAVAFSPDAKIVITGGENRRAHIWDAAGRKRGEIVATAGSVRSVVFSPDGRTLATVCISEPGRTTSKTRSRPSVSQIQLWETGAFSSLGPPLTQSGGMRSVAFSPDSKTLLAGGRNGAVGLWDLSDRHSTPLMGHSGEVRSVSVSPDGANLLTGSEDGTARYWSIAEKETLGKLPHQDLVVAVAFSPDGQTLLTGSYDGTAQLWDAQTYQRLGKPLEHRSYVHAVAFSPDGLTILTGSEDGTARLWDTATCRPIGPALMHGAIVRAAVFSPTGRRIATAGGTTAYLWPVLPDIEGDPDRLRLWVEVRTGLQLGADEGVRMLSPEEWQERRTRLASAALR
jgi:WD40 repeat protein